MNTGNTVLILTGRLKGEVEIVESHLKSIEQTFVRINSEELMSNVKLFLKSDSTGYGGWLSISGKRVDTADIKSIWYRRPYQLIPKKELCDLSVGFIQEEFKSAIWSFSTLQKAYWMNHPLQGLHLLEHNKLYQINIAEQVGLAVPDTIITNDYDELLAFCEKNSGVIAIKVIRSRLFQDDADNTFGIYTQKMTKDQITNHVADIGLAPLMAQAYIEKNIELRVTVVGENIFTCAIHSQDSERTKHDWRRYDFGKVKHEVYNLPDEIRTKIKLFMSKCNLTFGAIDMIISPEGKYYFLEVNPSGQYGWIERLTGMPISKAIADTLSNPPEIYLC